MNPLFDFKRYPAMTHWLDPVLLVTLALRLVASWSSGGYADRRLIIAALDPVGLDEQLKRADLTDVMVPDADGAVWLDYVSDLGDGFDATYAVAYCLAREKIEVGGHVLPRGSALIMGGDQVYPAASHDEYNRRLRTPYDLAWPRDSAGPSPPVYLIPGNHDWYDGLNAFHALFCRRKPTEIGHWRTHQRRSYFALELAPGWWLWGIDIALTVDMDQPQAEYFVSIAEAMPDRANIILCTAEPGWYGGDKDEASFKSLDYAAWLAANARRSDDPERSKDLKVVVAISGDSHHYARYASEFGMQFLTAGGGGAFLHGTQELKPRIRLDWLEDRDAEFRLETCFPTQQESRRLLLGDWAFAYLNKRFSLLLGLVYGLLACWLTGRAHLDAYILSYLLLALGFCAYGAKQAKGWFEKPILLGLAHAGLHWGAIVVLAALAQQLDDRLFGPGLAGWPLFFSTLAIVVPPGALIAGTIFGGHYWFTARFADFNHEDAFSAMRLLRGRHWLRLRIHGDTLTIYPVGLSRIPERREWRPADSVPDSERDGVASAYHPPRTMRLHLIEEPVVIRAAAVAPVASTAKAEELQAATPGQGPAEGDR